MTSTDLAVKSEESSLTLLPPQRPPALAAQQMLIMHADMMDTAYDMAKRLCSTAIVPTRFRGKPQDGCAAILYGAELGLNPIQSLQRVVPIHGMPTLEARTMVGLLKSRGYKVKTVAQSDESVTVRGRDLDGDEHESTWTIERARRAGYVPTPSSEKSLQRPTHDEDWVTVTKTWDGKAKKSIVGNMKYITDPQAMLKAKAQSEVCRDMAPDVLIGISYSQEELESERFDDAPAPARATSAPVTVAEIFGDDPEPAPPAKAEPKKRAPKAKPEPEQEPQDVETVDEPAEPASDPDPSPSDPEPTPEPEQVSEPSNQAEQLLADAQIADVEDQLVIIRLLAGREDIAAAADLDETELVAVVTKLEKIAAKSDLTEWANDALFRAAALEAEAQEAAAAADTNTEGK
jgi:hypothetical protein